ncbi:hypothetical protein GPJ56_007262 [Histomonas meleagridis]|uniref:uncharacterized protein n=1 Tax=Histomonas meleagridis TaxID=135588 RepID=UPI00355A8EF4|nr:hypothetical protein GPJ56_007262 [Histomonas meleagridis]KAH0804108.1 hypothetical protein GO595_002938 [Histomonas meleagridis]
MYNFPDGRSCYFFFSDGYSKNVRKCRLMIQSNNIQRNPLEPDPLPQIEFEPRDFNDCNLNSIPPKIDGMPKYDISTPFHLSTNDSKKQTENLNLPQNEADEERSSATTGFSFSNNVTLNSPPNNDVIFEGIEGESFGISQIEQFLNINHENYGLNVQKNNTVVEEYQQDQEHQQDQQQDQQDQSDFQEFDEESW